MSSENRVIMTRVIFGVASVGATLGLVYLYNKFQEKKNQSDKSTGGGSSRLRRHSSKSGEVKKVTFKTEQDDERLVMESSGGRRAMQEEGEDNDSKLYRNELSKPGCGREVVEGQQLQSRSLEQKSALRETTATTDVDSSVQNNTTNNEYENNSTLRLEDSTAAAVEEEVVTRSKDGPLMTSTPLPGGTGGGVSLRAAAAVFEPHSSDLRSSAQQKGEVEGASQQPATMAVTPETDYDSFAFKKEIKIPREVVPGLIGKKGCNIKGIQAQSGTTINFHDETLDNGDRICVIRGAPGNVTIAESMIEKFMMEQPTVYTETLTVPLSAVGRIIGRGGDTIRSIQDFSKARVNVESHNHHFGSGDSGPTRTITIKGSEDQINAAKQLIIEKVDEERNLRKNIDLATASRTPRRGGGVSPSSGPPTMPSSMASVNSGSTEPALPLKQDGILEVFVSCVYHPNDFWIQVVGRDSIELDKLCESMTDFYGGQNEQTDPQFSVGDIVAAPFEVDGKIYRAKIVRIDDNGVEVSYLDYGDRRVLPISEVYELHPNFLKLRFQAIQATLNLGCIGDKWDDEVINVFCDLTYCAQWQSLTAKVKDYLKDVEDASTVIWIELLDKDTNIGEELVRRGLATPKGPSGCNGAQGLNRKSYAAVALGVPNSAPTQPLITSSDPTVQESLENERNGN